MSSSTVLERPPTGGAPSPAPPAPTEPTRPAPPVGPAQAGPGRETVRKILLGCGVLSSTLYVGTEMYAWTQYPGYSPVSQAFSELLAEGAPTRPFMVAMAGLPYNALVAALGVGVLLSPGRTRVLRITGALLLLYALISYLGGTVFQMDTREVEGSARTAMHERATAVMVVSMLAAMCVGAFVHGTRFRVYSLATLLTVIVFAGLTFQQVMLLEAHQPAPWMGVIERVNIYAWMLWVAVLAASLWRARAARAPDGSPHAR